MDINSQRRVAHNVSGSQNSLITYCSCTQADRNTSKHTVKWAREVPDWVELVSMRLPSDKSQAALTFVHKL